VSGSTGSGAVTTALATADFRRQVSALYAQVRAAPDAAQGHRLWAAGREILLGHHPVSPLLPQHRGPGARVPVADYDPSFRFVVPVLAAPAHRMEVRTGTDGLVRYDRIGRVELDGLGALDVWWHEGYGGGLFVPLRDSLAGSTGYGGGRYLLDTIKGADLGATGDSLLVLDLNFAYHPSCAYDPAWACPLAPTGNVLAAAVPIGELYQGPWAHRATCIDRSRADPAHQPSMSPFSVR